MSLWWVQKLQLDPDQLHLIEGLSLQQDFLVLGSAGSGKTNVLLRRAQFVRGQGMPNVQVLTFTRPLAEFVRTGCYDPEGREIFPPALVTTIESWLRALHRRHKKALPAHIDDLTEWKRELAASALELDPGDKLPRFDALFVDEAQDLLAEEVKVLRKWGGTLFFVGDDCQKIHEGEGLEAVKQVVSESNIKALKFHYRVAPEICRVADRILIPKNKSSLESTSHYQGPRPATVEMQARIPRTRQLELVMTKLAEQVRVYGDLIRQGDRIGIVVARKRDRETVLDAIDRHATLAGKGKVVRSKDSGESYDTSFNVDTPICILTVKGCKGLEFRAVHWMFANDLSQFHGPEHYYTVVTRAKTSLDVYATGNLPEILARAHSQTGVAQW